MNKFKIANFVIELDYPDCFIQREFQQFQCSTDEVSQLYWSIKRGYPQKPNSVQWKNFGNFRITQDETTVYVQYSNKEDYLIKFITYENEYKNVTYYIGTNDMTKMEQEEIEQLGRYLYYFHREAFLLAELFENAIAIHSSTLIYNNQGYIFSGPSGTGKTTHTNLWTKLYHTEILDGDIILCKKEKDDFWLYGMPWHGTSGLYQNKRVRLGGIVFLEQSKTNEVKKLDTVEGYKKLVARIFSPRWFQPLNDKVIDTVTDLLKKEVPVYLLKCRPEESAVNLIKGEIDSNQFNESVSL